MRKQVFAYHIPIPGRNNHSALFRRILQLSVSWPWLPPIVPIYYEDGTLNSWDSQTIPVAYLICPVWFNAEKEQYHTELLVLCFIWRLRLSYSGAFFPFPYSNSDISGNALVPFTMPSRAATGNAISKSVNRNNNILERKCIITYKTYFEETNILMRCKDLPYRRSISTGYQWVAVVITWWNGAWDIDLFPTNKPALAGERITDPYVAPGSY